MHGLATIRRMNDAAAQQADPQAERRAERQPDRVTLARLLLRDARELESKGKMPLIVIDLLEAAEVLLRDASRAG